MSTEEQIETERIVQTAAAWQKWVLSLDKYIDPDDQPKKHRYALVTGLVLCALFFLLMLLMGLPNKSALVLLVGVWLIGIVFLEIDRTAWRRDRIWQSKLNKQSYDCGCNRNNLRPFPEKSWLKSRLVEHYTCTVSEIVWNVWVGWTIATVLLLILSWLFTFLTK